MRRTSVRAISFEMNKFPESCPWQYACSTLDDKPQLSLYKVQALCAGPEQRLGGDSALMVILNQSEAETLEQLLNGERLWSWPNGRVQLGQSFPDLSVINNLLRQGLLDQAYEPTEAARAALQSWQTSIGLPTTAVVRSSDGGLRPRLSTD